MTLNKKQSAQPVLLVETKEGRIGGGLAGGIKSGKFSRHGGDLYKLTKHWQNLLQLAKACVILVDHLLLVEHRDRVEHT